MRTLASLGHSARKGMIVDPTIIEAPSSTKNATRERDPEMLLLAHEDTEYEEWGFSGSIRYQPRTDGQGLSMNLGSAWGATQSGVRSLWSRQDASGLARGTAMNAAQRFQAQLGYGFAGRRKDSLCVPFIAAQAADGGGEALRMGVKLTSGPNVEAGLEFGRQVPSGVPDYAVRLGGVLRW